MSFNPHRALASAPAAAYITQPMEPSATSAQTYQVLARKYRPSTFEDMIGQEAMVRTLRNAFETGRIAHAFMLTGVRGIGKTTTARLLARALNYESADHEGPSTDLTPLGVHCEAIMGSAHMDVLEMDAASRTGVENMREMLEGVRYAPVSARYKVYIIDEVHMLSTGAFNALLKTLEEPPDHAKFVFATTEIRKVPVTVLSRCQRFDLRRVDTDILKTHLSGICQTEGIGVSDDGLAMIARAAEGSVRDGLSLLDQAMVQATDGADVSGEQVRDMLGLADRTRVLDLFEAIADGNAAAAMQGVRDQYHDGASPEVLIRDLLDITHEVSRAKVVGQSATFDADSQSSTRLAKLGETLSQGQVTRLWQMLLKAHDDVREAPVPVTAAEMAVLNLSQAADMPAPEIAAAIISEMRSGNFSWEHVSEKLRAKGVPFQGKPGESSAKASPVKVEALSAPPASPTRSAPPAPPPSATPPKPVMPVAVNSAPTFESFADFVAALNANSQPDLLYDVEHFVKPVSFKPGHISFEPAPMAPRDLAAKMIRALKDMTGELWIVDDTVKGGGEPLGTVRRRKSAEDEATLRAHPAFTHPLLAKAKFIEHVEITPISTPDTGLPVENSDEEDMS